MTPAAEWVALPTWTDIVARLESEPELATRPTIPDELRALGSDPDLAEDHRLRVPALLAMVEVALNEGVQSVRPWLIAQVEGQRQSEHRGIALRSTLDVLMLTYTLEEVDAGTWVEILEDHEWALCHPRVEQPHIRDATDALRQVLEGSRPPLPADLCTPDRKSRILGVAGRLMRIRRTGDYIDNVEESIALLIQARDLKPPEAAAGASLDLADAYLSRTVQDPRNALVQAIECFREARKHPASLSPRHSFRAAAGLAMALGDLARRTVDPREGAALWAEQSGALAAADAAAHDDTDRAVVLMLRGQYADSDSDDRSLAALDQLRRAVTAFDRTGPEYNQVLSRQRLAELILGSGIRDPQKLDEVVTLAERGEALAVEYGFDFEVGAAREQLVSAHLLLGNWQPALRIAVGLVRSALERLLTGVSPIARQAYATIAATGANNAAYAMLRLRGDPYAAVAMWDSSIGYTTRRSWTALDEATPDDPDVPVLDSMLAVLRDCDAAAQLIVTIAGACMVIVTHDDVGLRAQVVHCDIDLEALAGATANYSLFLAAQTDGTIVSGAEAKRELLSVALRKATPVVDALAAVLDRAGVPRSARVAIAGSFGFASLAIGAVPLTTGGLFGDRWTVRAVPGWTFVPQHGPAAISSGNSSLSSSVVVADTREDLPLPYSRIEGDTVAATIASRTHLVGNGARRTKVTEALEAGSGIAYFACHAYFAFDDPWNSGVKLADGDWTASDIAQLDLSRYDLAVLSACESAVTDMRRAPTEYIGVRTSLLQAGVRRVIGSAWAVNDASTALLMARVLDNWRRSPDLPLETALWDAQSWVRHATADELVRYLSGVRRRYRWWHVGERPGRGAIGDLIRMLERRDGRSMPYAHPFYWAAFTVW